MRVLIIALLAAISYAQTAQAGGHQYPNYNHQLNQGYGQSGYPGGNQGNYPRANQAGYPTRAGGFPPPNQQNQAGPYNPGAAQSGMLPTTGPSSILQCTQKRQETCHLKRMKTLCDMDQCCVFEYKDRKPYCYGIDDAPYSQVECKDFPRDTCEKDPSCSWSMKNYECDMKWDVNQEFIEQCSQNPSNPECYKNGSMITGGGLMLFCFGCCCGYFIRPCYANHNKRKAESSNEAAKKSGEPSWDYQMAPEKPPQDYHHAKRSKTPQQLPYYGHATTGGAGEHTGHENFHAIHFEP